MRRIAIFTYSIYTVGGEQRVVCLLANELSKRHEVTIFTMDKDDSAGNIFGLSDRVDVRYFHPYKGDVISFCLRGATHALPQLVYEWTSGLLERAYCADKYAALMNELIADDYDVVIGTAWQLSILLGKLKKKYNESIRTIAWEHNSYEAYFEEKYLYLYNNEKLFAENMQYVDEVVVLNEDYREKYKKRLNIDSIVIYNPKTFESNQKSTLDNKIMLACSRIDYQKGIDLLLDSFRLFYKDNEEWILKIAGDGRDINKYKAMAKEYGILDRVEFLGQISNVKEEMLNASIFVLPSRFEGFPMSVTEAFEVGIPVIAYDIPAMYPFKECGGAITTKCFDVKEYAENMLKLAESKERREDVASCAIKFADSLCMDKIIEKWNEIV